MRSLVAVALLVLAGCGVDPNHVVVDVHGAPSWMITGVTGAAQLMLAHGVEVVAEDGSGVPIRVEPAANLEDGSAWGDFHHHTITVADDVAQHPDHFFKSCLIAHEIGHAIGMQHVDADAASLMLPSIYIDQRGTDVMSTCYWSTFDQAELDRVRAP